MCCFSVNTGLYAAFKERNDVFGVYCGHVRGRGSVAILNHFTRLQDHDSDFSGTLGGIQLSYGRKSGHGGYGESSCMLSH